MRETKHRNKYRKHISIHNMRTQLLLLRYASLKLTPQSVVGRIAPSPSPPVL